MYLQKITTSDLEVFEETVLLVDEVDDLVVVKKAYFNYVKPDSDLGRGRNL